MSHTSEEEIIQIQSRCLHISDRINLRCWLAVIQNFALISVLIFAMAMLGANWDKLNCFSNVTPCNVFVNFIVYIMGVYTEKPKLASS